ncbi:MAG: ATP-dependent Clp protease adaptor ClpS [Acidobacteriota bacterium]
MDKKTGGQVLAKTRTKTAKPPLYKVILHNDDYTTMDFVVLVLENIFDKSPAEAHRIMMHVHLQGSGLCGAYPHEIAETKLATVHAAARHAGFPLRATMEEQ